MKLEFYQIDAFTDTIFQGNPACVVPLKVWPADDVLSHIANENAISETAFFIDQGDKIHLRWFTPDIEMDLCGHATLAVAHYFKTIRHYSKQNIVFHTRSGDLNVRIDGERYYLNLPARPPQPARLPESIQNALNIKPAEVLKSRDYILVYDTEAEIRDIRVERPLFDKINLDPGGVAVTARGGKVDFVSRYFTPQASILEDPVTGSAHCSLIPFWSKRLGKCELVAVQLSRRTGQILCRDAGERVIIGGHAKTYAAGTLWTD